MSEIEHDIIKAIPDPEFSVQGVFDFEELFAMWDMNFQGNEEQYKAPSIILVALEYPHFSLDEIITKAGEGYDKAVMWPVH